MLPDPLEGKLWNHQKEAIAFATEQLRGPADVHASLVRMPTGTGKTGVIAVLSVAAPPAKWTLVLTPWANLCTQMVDDLRERFWHISSWRPSPAPNVERLLPSNTKELLARKDEHLILVSTFATLVAIFKMRSIYDTLATKLSQIFVDEGHYEPAVEWGQAVKQLKVPTLLLTATPYRNDLKLFRVGPENVFHFTHAQAEEERIIRALSLHEMSIPEPTQHRDLIAWCDEFGAYWEATREKRIATGARAIICCNNMATVKTVTNRLRRTGINALGIHDRFGEERRACLKKDTPDPHAVDFEVWVHQNKLTEGLDDKRFRIVAILNRIRTDRKLIQQIGRVLRRGSDDEEPATVLYSAGLQVKRSWENYRAFETQANLNDPLRYKRLLDSLLSSQPDMEYFDGQFRRRFEPSSPDLKQEIRLLPSVVAREVLPDFDWDQCTAFISDYLELEDCILLGPDGGFSIGPQDARLWIYAVFGNSPVLISGSQYEIRLGAMAAVQHGTMIFLSDTEGKFPDVYVNDHTRKLSPQDLGKVLSEDAVPREVSLQNPWPAGPSVWRSSIYANDLGTTSPQLTDSIYMCTGVRATLPSAIPLTAARRHYIGFSRGRISEQLQSTARSEFDLAQFVSWTRDFAADIESRRRKLPEFFSRYLIPVKAPSIVDAAYLVLNVYDGEATMEDEAGNLWQIQETIISLSSKDERDGNVRFTGTVLFYREANPAEKLPCNFRLIYHRKSHRFTIQGERWNTTMFVQNSEGNERQGVVTFLNNHDESFTVAMRDPDLFYNGQSFYKIDYTFAEIRLANLLSTETILTGVTSEKGQFRRNQKNWSKSSLFGVLDPSTSGGLIDKYFPESEFVFCDDLGKEVADFVAVSFKKRRIALIHAKQGEGNLVSASALHVVVAQALKNLGVLGRAGPVPPEIERWNRRAKWSTSATLRWRKGAVSLPEKANLWHRIRDEILNHPDGRKDVWLVAGQSLKRAELMRKLNAPNRRDPIVGQIVHLLSSLHATCSQLQIALRVFCD
jgi:superfamily II DNA or RNA helicase